MQSGDGFLIQPTLLASLFGMIGFWIHFLKYRLRVSIDFINCCVTHENAIFAIHYDARFIERDLPPFY